MPNQPELDPLPALDHLRDRWDEVLPGLLDAVLMAGVHQRDIYLTGSPATMTLATWATVTPCWSAGRPVAVIRSGLPGRLTVIDLDRCYLAVIEDIIEAVTAILRRRRCRLDEEQEAKVQELWEMIASSGLQITSPAAVGVGMLFQSWENTYSGSIYRSEYRSGDPAWDRFTITVEVGVLSYAEALAVLAEIRRGLRVDGPQQKHEPERFT